MLAAPVTDEKGAGSAGDDGDGVSAAVVADRCEPADENAALDAGTSGDTDADAEADVEKDADDWRPGAAAASRSSMAAARRSMMILSASSARAIVAFSGGSAEMLLSAANQSSRSCCVAARRRYSRVRVTTSNEKGAGSVCARRTYADDGERSVAGAAANHRLCGRCGRTWKAPAVERSTEARGLSPRPFMYDSVRPCNSNQRSFHALFSAPRFSSIPHFTGGPIDAGRAAIRGRDTQRETSRLLIIHHHYTRIPSRREARRA